MTPTDAARYRELAEAAWRWVLAQVEDEAGPRIPARVDVDTGLSEPSEDAYRDGLHEGIGGLAHVLAEIRLSRPWTEAEADLATAVAERLRARIPEVSDASFFDGLSSIVGALIALDAPGADEAVHRLLATAETSGIWACSRSATAAARSASASVQGRESRISDRTWASPPIPSCRPSR